MADFLKAVTKLAVAGDGRTADNWNSYQLQVEFSLSGKEVGGLYLDDVLLGRDEGKEPTDPGTNRAAWIAAAPADGAARTAEQYAEQVKARSLWSRANRLTVSCIMATLPEELHEACAQRPVAHELWQYLKQRFSDQTLTSIASLWVRLFQLRVEDFSGVSDYLTALNKLELELVRAG